MGNQKIALLFVILLNLDTFLLSQACIDSPPTHTPKVKQPHHPKLPAVPEPPVGNNPPKPPCPCPSPPSPPSPLSPPGTCPTDALKLKTCVDLLGGLIHVQIGRKAKAVCCPLLGGLVGLDAAVCLCTAIRLRIPPLNINVLVPVALRVIRACGVTPPPNFKCPPPI